MSNKIIPKTALIEIDGAIDDFYDEAEIILHDFYDVANNPHFANKAKQTSTKFHISKEIAIEQARKNVKKQKELGTGIFALTPKDLSKYGKTGGSISGKKTYEMKIGIHSLTPKEKSEAGKKSGAQRWMCEETGFISNAAGVIRYQKARGIDTSKRKRIE